MNAKSEIRLIDTPSIGISQKVPMKAMNRPSETHIARRKRRNRASTVTISTNPVAPLRISRSRRARRICEPSFQVVRRMPSGICAFAWITYSLTESATHSAS